MRREVSLPPRSTPFDPLFADGFNYTPGILTGQGPWTTSFEGGDLTVASPGNVINTSLIDTQQAALASGVIDAWVPTDPWTLELHFTRAAAVSRYIEVIIGTDDNVHNVSMYHDFDGAETILGTDGNAEIDVTPSVIGAGSHVLKAVVASGIATLYLDGVAIGTAAFDCSTVSGGDVTIIIDHDGVTTTATINAVSLS